MHNCGLLCEEAQPYKCQLQRIFGSGPTIWTAAALFLIFITAYCLGQGFCTSSISVKCRPSGSRCYTCCCRQLTRDSVSDKRAVYRELLATALSKGSENNLARRLLQGVKGTSSSITRVCNQTVKATAESRNLRETVILSGQNPHAGNRRSSRCNGFPRILQQDAQQRATDNSSSSSSTQTAASDSSSSDALTSIKQSSQSWQHDANDNSGYAAYTNARVLDPDPPDTHNVVHAFTPEAAEAVAYSDSSGIHRLVTPQKDRSYATVDPEPASTLSASESAVKPYARSNQDIPGRYRRRDSSGNGAGPPYQSNYGKKHHKKGDIDDSSDPKYSSSGAVEQPILVVGQLSYAQTYSGATAVASSDSLAMSKGGKPGTPDGTTIAASNTVTWVPGLISANVPQQSSVGVTSAQRVGSLAASGAADGKISLAQGDSAVAMAQTETMEWDENDEGEAWHDPVIELTGDWTSADDDDSIWARLGFGD